MMISLTSCENLVKWNIKITTSVQIATNPGLFKPEQISFALIRTDYVCSLSSGFAYWKLMYSFSLDLNYVKSLKIWLQKSTECSKKHNKNSFKHRETKLMFRQSISHYKEAGLLSILKGTSYSRDAEH